MTGSQTARLLSALVALSLCLGLAACTSTRARRGTPAPSGFLGDYSQLENRDGYPAALVYINPDTDFTRYDSIYIESVTLWVSEDKKVVSEENRQMLADTLYTALHKELEQFFVIVDGPSPSALQLRAALTEVRGANVPLRTISTVIPQLRAVSAAAGLSADVAYTVGTASVEIEAIDSVTHVRVAASVDERSGNKALFTMRTFQKWGDVEAACRYWARRVTFRAAAYGVQRKPGTEMPDPSGRRTL
jgi:hypothetical protein